MKEVPSRLTDHQAQRLWTEIARDLKDGAGRVFTLQPDPLALEQVGTQDDLRRFLKQL
jgi:S-adenosylmethionine:diacylglycerol 3-amino-3-carboxypropyl transferase